MVQKSIEAKVRPAAPTIPEKGSLQDAARIYVSVDAMMALSGSVKHGSRCLIERLSEDEEPISREAVLWTPVGKKQNANVVLLTRAFQEAAGFKLGDQVKISLIDAVPDAEEVVVQDVGEGEKPISSKMKYPPSWESRISTSLDRAEHIFPGMIFQDLDLSKIKRTFKVISVNSQSTNVARFQVESTEVRILDPGAEQPPPERVSGGQLLLTGVPGLAPQIKALNSFLRGFCRPFWFEQERETCGLVIHGGPGTGKTFILERLADTKWGRPFWIEPTDKLSTIQEVFAQARAQQPSMIFIEKLEELIDKERSNYKSIIRTIGGQLDILSKEAAANNALPLVVVIATCSDYISDVPQELQKASRLDDHIALPIPRTSERLEIFEYMKPPIDPKSREQILREVSQKTHAYNASDLRRLIKKAKKIGSDRLDTVVQRDAEQQYFITEEDMLTALRDTTPTAMHDINLNPPSVYWKDIGGQSELKAVLSKMIKRTKTANPVIHRLVLHPPKGILLYGPPGCSKTLSAQAMAAESDFNYFSVKGAELLNMYVGESERSIRKLFERAKAAAPAIIFFDEIDAIAGHRSGSAAAARSTSNVNTLTTLLTEMDGFETLSGVLILAATNRPESIDPALLRPGRFDRTFYVGPPDLDAREAIFRVCLGKLDTAADVDFAELSELTEGYSGAEISKICNDAGEIAADRVESQQEDAEPYITMADLVVALSKTEKNITQEMIDGYEKWARQFTRK